MTHSSMKLKANGVHGVHGVHAVEVSLLYQVIYDYTLDLPIYKSTAVLTHPTLVENPLYEFAPAREDNSKF